MAHLNKVVRSINMPGEQVCVDIFARPDGTFGFDEYRRDPEDMRGWYSIGNFGDLTFASADLALAAARREVAWLNEVLG